MRNSQQKICKLSKRNNETICTLVLSTDRAHMDLTGRFPYHSIRGNEYIKIVHHVDLNTILGQAIKNCQPTTITLAWTNIYKQLESAVTYTAVGSAKYGQLIAK